MNLEKLYKKQEELDKYIMKNRNIVMSDEELLDKTILALLVEVGELANATRCFKHWSLKGPESKERLLDELADVWHFYLSIGNQIGRKFKHLNEKPKNEIEKVFQMWEKTLNFNRERVMTQILLELYRNTTISLNDKQNLKYESMGKGIYLIGKLLGFTNQEVEQAYLKKHEENYKRQREGY